MTVQDLKDERQATNPDDNLKLAKKPRASAAHRDRKLEATAPEFQHRAT